MPLNFSRVTLEGLLSAAPVCEVQLVLIIIHAFVWHFVVMWWLPPVFKARITSMRAKDRFLDLNSAMFKKAFFVDFQGDCELLLDFVAVFFSVIVQHFVGGLLCLPSLLGLFSPSVGAAFACHGALCEVGWEMQDTLVRAKEVLFDGKLGRKKNPLPLLLVLATHHTAAQCLVLPLNVYYRDNKLYHEAVLLLQGAAFVAFFSQQFGFTRDMKIPSQRIQMKISVAVAFACVLWSRVFRYGYLWYALLTTFHADGHRFLLGLATPPVILLTLFNVAIIADFSAKFWKFVVVSGKFDDEEEAESCTSSPSASRTPEQEERPILLSRVDGGSPVHSVIRKRAVTIDSSSQVSCASQN